ncbi:unnamed protein product [Amoebophrya sp. A25]|nr:unnamed protein product [Amoebophrya sp. A25]|eukprot:GSA25T00008282001.1
MPTYKTKSTMTKAQGKRGAQDANLQDHLHDAAEDGLPLVLIQDFSNDLGLAEIRKKEGGKVEEEIKSRLKVQVETSSIEYELGVVIRAPPTWDKNNLCEKHMRNGNMQVGTMIYIAPQYQLASSA